MSVTNYDPDKCVQVLQYLQAQGMPVLIWPQSMLLQGQEEMYADESAQQEAVYGELPLQAVIATDLVQMGFRRGQAGFTNLVRSIFEISRQAGGAAPHLNAEIYPRVADYSGTTVSSVERTIRNAIESVWKRSNLEELELMYPYPYSSMNGRPTNAEFLTNMAARYR